jgi:TPP-dependent indolepyruvate ferredoxin oxidoreductase alpha subunit
MASTPGCATCGRSRKFACGNTRTWRDTLQALEDLGLDRGVLEALGIRILKVAMPWPVDRETYAEFADGLDDILVIEDKREQIENALRDVCYAWPESRRPRIVGRRDESGQKLVDDVGDLSPDKIARVIAQRIGHIHDSERMRADESPGGQPRLRRRGLPLHGQLDGTGRLHVHPDGR